MKRTVGSIRNRTQNYKGKRLTYCLYKRITELSKGDDPLAHLGPYKTERGIFLAECEGGKMDCLRRLHSCNSREKSAIRSPQVC
jgi:hypothetical protein